MPTTLAALLDALTSEPGRPRLTWYGPEGERIELSGAVLGNWVSKTTNLLVEELDAEPGTVVTLDLPAHWRTLVWALATWRAGAEAHLIGGASEPDGGAAPSAGPVVTTDPASWAGHRPGHELVAVSLGALARRFDGELPRGAIDAASAVMTYGDQLGYVPPADPDALALTGLGDDVSHRGLLPWADSEGGAAPAGARVLVAPAAGAAGLRSLLAVALRTWAGDGSVVVLAASTADELAADPARRERLVTSERVTWDA